MSKVIGWILIALPLFLVIILFRLGIKAGATFVILSCLVWLLGFWFVRQARMKEMKEDGV